MNRLEMITAMLEESPHDDFLHYALALEFAKTEGIPAAFVKLVDLINRSPNYLGAYYQTAKYAEELAKFEEAVAYYKKGIIIAQNQADKKAERELKEALFTLQDED